MILKLSDSFTLRNEANCSYLIHRTRVLPDGYNGSMVILLPPFIGYILAELGKTDYETSRSRIAKGLDVSEEAVEIFINNLRKKDYKQFNLSETEGIIFPDKLLEESDIAEIREFITTADFNPTDDFKAHRPGIPLSMNLMITSKCTTDCIYCYAHRSLGKRDLTNEEIIDFLHKARKLGVVNISITGGDIFAMQGWREILKTVMDLDFDAFLSTKTPLTSDELKDLKGIGINEIQFSLDSTDDNTLCKMLKVAPGYLNKVEEMLSACELAGIKVQIRTVLTKHNSTPESVRLLYDFLCGFKCIKEWDVTPAFMSGFKADYKSYEVSNEDLVEMYRFRNEVNAPFPMSLNKIGDDGYKLQREKDTKNYVKCNQICLGNTYVLSVLASGDCTVCEMLYENPEYLIGNILESSLDKIWNSRKALELYCPHQEHIDKKSPCATCQEFSECRQSLETRVCYSDIAKIYGKDSFSFPDPRCPKANPVKVIL